MFNPVSLKAENSDIHYKLGERIRAMISSFRKRPGG
jgi:hypothetical protein